MHLLLYWFSFLESYFWLNIFVLSTANCCSALLSKSEKWAMVKYSQEIQKISIFTVIWWNGAMAIWCNYDMIIWKNSNGKIAHTHQFLHNLPLFYPIGRNFKIWSLVPHINFLLHWLFEQSLVQFKTPTKNIYET